MTKTYHGAAAEASTSPGADGSLTSCWVQNPLFESLRRASVPFLPDRREDGVRPALGTLLFV
jgi:hypothetical protein